MSKKLGILAALVLSIFLTVTADAQAHNHAFLWTPQSGMRDLGVPAGWTDSQALGISSAGQVVGYVVNANGDSAAAVWTSSHGWRLLNKRISKRYSVGAAINKAGQVVGTTYATGTIQHAFIWTLTDGMKDLGTLGGSSSAAFGINKAGQVVGQSTTATGSLHGFIWSSDKGMQDLGVIQGSDGGSVAQAINDRGVSAGLATGLEGLGVAVFWIGETIHTLGSLGFNSETTAGPTSGATGINNFNQLVGSYTPSINNVPVHAFLWSRTSGIDDLGMTEGASSSAAAGINSVGNVVGVNVMLDGTTQAFFWTASTGMQSLGTLGGGSSTATGINDSGQVVGFSEEP